MDNLIVIMDNNYIVITHLHSQKYRLCPGLPGKHQGEGKPSLRKRLTRLQDASRLMCLNAACRLSDLLPTPRGVFIPNRAWSLESRGDCPTSSICIYRAR